MKKHEAMKRLAERMGWLCEDEDVERLCHSSLNKEQVERVCSKGPSHAKDNVPSPAAGLAAASAGAEGSVPSVARLAGAAT